MKRSWTALAVTLFALGVLAGCNDYNNSVQYDTGATLISISPSAMAAGTPANAAQCKNTSTGQNYACFTIFLLASATNGFISTSVVEWNGQKMPTTYIDATDISATIPYSLLATPGSVYVNAYQPQSGTGNNGLSNALTFIIYGAPNPYPSLSSVSPTSAAYCNPTTACANVPITLTGSNFIPTSQNGGSSVTYTGLSTYGIETAITVTSISSTQLKATIPGTLLCATDTAQINVINPPSAVCVVNCPNLGGGDTNNPPPGQQATTQTFSITNSSAINSCPAQTIPTPLTAEETAAISQDGRYVAYASPQNGTSQIVVRDTCLGAAKDCTASTRTVSAAADSTAGNGDSHNAAMTLDGRYVAFSSVATNLVESAPTGRQVYLRDTCLGASGSCKPSTLLVSTDVEGKLSGTEGILPSVSSSGRYVAFLAVTPSQAGTSTNTANTATAANSTRQVFVRDTCLGAAHCTPSTTLISLQPGDIPADSSKPAGPALAVAEEAPTVSQDGRYVGYASTQNGASQILILLRDTCFGAASGCTPSTRTVSAAADGSAANGDSHNAVMTPDGRYVAFSSAATNLVENAPAGRQVYLRDTCIGAPASCKPSTLLGSADEEGKLAGTESILPSMSTSGHFIAFLAVTPSQAASAATATTAAQASAPGAANSGLRQVFVRDTCLGAASCAPKTTRISLQSGDVPAGSAKPAGPALAGLAKQIALPDSKSSTVFTPTVPIDDHVFLAIPNGTE